MTVLKPPRPLKRHKYKIPKGYVSSQQAANIIAKHDFELSAARISRLVDKGLPTGRRLEIPPKRPRILSRRILRRMIQNFKNGLPPTHDIPGLEAVNLRIEQRKKGAERARAHLEARKNGKIPEKKAKPDKKLVRSQDREKNLAITEVWIARHSTGQSPIARKIREIVEANADLPMNEFRERILPQIQKLLGIE